MSGVTAITAAISGTGADVSHGVFCHDNRFGLLVTGAIKNFGATEADIIENYIGTATGGTLVITIV